MATKVLMIHGRNQASDDRIAADPTMLEAYITGKKREFLAGLAKGLVLSGIDPIAESATIFPFYGNNFSERVKQLQDSGVPVPELETAAPGAVAETADDEHAQQLAQLQAGLLNEMATRLNFNANAEWNHLGVGTSPTPESLGPQDLLRIPFLTAALQFVSRKTGAPAAIIRAHLADVAYYLGNDDVRTLVLGVVRDELGARSRAGDDLIIIAHSLGTVVAYDLLATDEETIRTRNVRLLVTAGSPLGLSTVKKRLRGVVGRRKAQVSARVPALVNTWINAYDVADVVALIHPLSPEFGQSPTGSDRRRAHQQSQRTPFHHRLPLRSGRRRPDRAGISLPMNHHRS